MNKRTRGILCALAGGTLWGYSGTIGQYLFTNYTISSEWLTTARMLCAGFLLILFSLMRHISLKKIWQTRASAIHLIVFSIAGLTAVQLTYMKAISYSNSATATALQYLGQALIMAVTCIQLMRLPTGKEWTALFLAVGGVFLLCTQGNLHALALSPSAMIWGLGSAVSLMLYTMLSRKLIQSYGSIPVTGCGMLIGGIVLCIVTQAWNQIPTFDLTGWIYVGIIILFGTAAAFTLYLQGVSDVGGVMASLLACAEPVSATLITTIWLKSHLVFTDYLAIVMILCMSVLLALPEKATS